MSFDIFLQSCNVSDEIKEVVNPFTGETQQVAGGGAVTDDERQAIKAVLGGRGRYWI
jgi:hypothetical protein